MTTRVHRGNGIRNAALGVGGARAEVGQGRGVNGEVGGDIQTFALVGHKIEQLVLFDWPAQSGPKLLEGHGLVRRGERISRVQGGVAAVSVGAAVHAVGAGLQADIFRDARSPPIFRFGIQDHVHLLNGVQRHQRRVSALTGAPRPGLQREERL